MVVEYLIITVFCVVVVRYSLVVKGQREEIECLEINQKMLIRERGNYLEEIERLNKKTIKNESKRILKSKRADKEMRTCPECGGEGNSVGGYFYSEESVYGKFECGCGCLWECNSKDF